MNADDTPTAARGRSRLVPAVAFGCLLVLAGLVFVLGRGSDPTDSSAEAGFARDMATHHAQAVQMAFIVRDKSADPELRGLAEDIIVTQSAQRGMFMGWLQQWGLSQATDRPRMAWMAGHGHGASAAAPSAATPPAAMPGMATDAELADLQKAAGKAAEILFLQLMIRHHEGGVQMAQALVDLSDREEVVTMAQHIVNSQTGEIKLMTDLLQVRGARPSASILD